MKKTQLTLRLAAHEGSLQRAIGTVERRGFRVLAFSAKIQGDTYQVELDVEGDRDPSLLCRQLDRLLDVQGARLAAS